MLRTSRTMLLTIAATFAALAAPTSASAGIMIGAESNGELANSNVSPEKRGETLDKVQAQGIKIVRVNWGWNEIASPTCGGQTIAELGDHTNPCYDWSRLDDFVAQTKARGLLPLVSFTRTPSWVLGSPNPTFMGNTDAQFQIVVDSYAAFMKAAGTRYNTRSAIGTIKYWTIWNEPGSKNHWYKPNVRRYALLYARAAVALKTAHPTALVAVGPTGPNSPPIKPVPFIREFVKWAPRYLPGSWANKRKYINAWAHNPYTNATNPPRYGLKNAPANMIGMAQMDRLFKELDKSPLTKGTKVWATEFGYETLPDRQLGISFAKQAQFQVEAFHYLDSMRRVTIGINYGITDPTQIADFQSGMFTAAGAKKPLFLAIQRMVSVPVPATDSLARIRGDKFKLGARVPIWGRSNLSPRKGVLAYRTSPRGVWRKVPGQKRGFDGTINATMKLSSARMYFSLYDGTYGPVRLIKTSR